ncbi:MAG: hypothetical protein WCA39_02790 [Nitrososphaeraceae archaeon]|jgi:hypothetical protein
MVAANNHYAGFGPETANTFRKMLDLSEVTWNIVIPNTGENASRDSNLSIILELKHQNSHSLSGVDVFYSRLQNTNLYVYEMWRFQWSPKSFLLSEFRRRYYSLSAFSIW